MSLRKTLSANVLSVATGVGLQALTAPLYLYFLDLDLFARWIQITSLSSYLSLSLNGAFYALMNKCTSEWTRGDHLTSRKTLGLSYLLLIICLILLTGAYLLLTSVGLKIGRDVFLILIVNCLSLQFIMVDCAYRTANQYSSGVNVLTLFRAIEWVATSALLILSKDVTIALYIYTPMKICSFLVLQYIVVRKKGAAVPVLFIPTLADLRPLPKLVLPQMMLSFGAASLAVGPQFAISHSFSAVASVAYNTTRTYLRLTIAAVNVIVYSSWPTINRLHASADKGMLKVVIARVIGSSALVAISLVCILAICAPWLFPVLFHGKVVADYALISMIGISVIINAVSVASQVAQLSTNIASLYGIVGSLVSLCVVPVLLLAAHSGSLTYTTGFQIAIEAMVLVLSLKASQYITSK